jgi:tetratricopeptide (TPR) repeat protein
MTGNAPIHRPGRQALIAELTELEASLASFSEAMHGINDESLIDAYREVLSHAPKIIANHVARIGPMLANDIATLNSQIIRHAIPREDRDLGPTERLRNLRAARGNVVADIESVLRAAALIGLHPSRPEINLPPAVVVERAGLEGLLSSMARRLDEVERGLTPIAAEAQSDAQPTARQVTVIGFFVESMTIELALAKLEARGKSLIDLASLGRAVEAMGTLTTDFVETTRGMLRSCGDGLRRAAEMIRPRVGRLVSGMKSISLKLAKTGGMSLQTTHNEPNDDQFWLEIEEGDYHFERSVLDSARSAFENAETTANNAIDRFPDSMLWRRNLSISSTKLGEVAYASGDFEQALIRFSASHNIFERLVAENPPYADWQRDLSVSHEKIGDLARANEEYSEARYHFSASLEIRKRLSATEPTNKQWLRDLSVSHERLGDLAIAEGNTTSAIRHYRASLPIARSLAESSPDNISLQNDVAITMRRLADLGAFTFIGDTQKD